MNCDLLIIGAGPSGLSAAYEASKAGLSTILVDEQHTPGGYLQQQVQTIQHLPAPFSEAIWRGDELANELVHRLRGLDVTFMNGYSLIGKFTDGSFGISNGDDLLGVKANYLVLATGAYEKAIPTPGWTLPGVLTIGAAQLLVNRDRVLPDKSAVVLGSNDMTVEIISQLKQVGMNVLAVLEQMDELVCTDQYQTLLTDMGIPVYTGVQQVMVEGETAVEGISFLENNKEQTMATDLLLQAGGLSPITDSSDLLDYEITFNEQLGGWVPTYNSSFQTSDPSVYVAGNAAGISNQGVSIITGSLVGIHASESLGALASGQAMLKKQQLWLELYKNENSDVFKERIAHIKQSVKEIHDSPEWGLLPREDVELG